MEKDNLQKIPPIYGGYINHKKYIEKIAISVQEKYQMGGLADGIYLDFATDVATIYANELLKFTGVVRWQPFDFKKIETRPTEYGKYLICRKDGKIHWETWNGSGWAYNHNEIIFWAVIVPPCN